MYRICWCISALLIFLPCSFLVSCTITPPPRSVTPELIAEAIPKARLISERRNANYMIERTDRSLQLVGASISDTLRTDIEAREQAITKALQGKPDFGAIKQMLSSLDDDVQLLGRVHTNIKFTKGSLENLGNGISPYHRAEVENEVLILQRAMKEDAWNKLGDAFDAFSNAPGIRTLAAIQPYTDQVSAFSQLDCAVSFDLKQQFQRATKQLRLALKSGTWDDVVEQFNRLPSYVFYPARIREALQYEQEFKQFLLPSEQQYMSTFVAALDRDLQGQSLAQALASAEKLESEMHRKFGGDYFPGYAPCVRVLSIDGGGVRGIIPAMILSELEHRTGKHIADMFDYIVGTSTGGILALALTVPSDSKNRSEPRYSADDLVTLYEKKTREIFPKHPGRTFRGIVYGPKFSPKGLEDVLNTYFGNTQLVDALTNVVIPAYLLEYHTHYYFSKFNSSFLYMSDVARATSAAPTYFPPIQFRNLPIGESHGTAIPHVSEPQSAKPPDLTFIDGGVFANNPTPHALAYINEEEHFDNTERYGARHPWLVVSLGTGQLSQSVYLNKYSNSRTWGLLEWAGPVLDIMFSEAGVEEEAKGFLGLDNYYFRLQPHTLTTATDSLDDASEKNIATLEEIARRYMRDNEKTLDELAHLLERPRPSECRAKERVPRI